MEGDFSNGWEGVAAQLIAHRRRFYVKGNDPERDLDREGNEIELPTPAGGQGTAPPLTSAEPPGRTATSGAG